MSKASYPPVHPGEVLIKDFLEPMKISQYHLAKSINVSPRRINEIAHGKRAITADTALRLGLFFAMEEQFWLNLQSHFDLETAKLKLGDRLKDQVAPFAA